MADAEDRTEAATSRRLQQAREDGRTPMSREAAPVAVLAATAAVILLVAPAAFARSTHMLAFLLEQGHRLSAMEGIAIAGRAGLLAATPFAGAALLAGSAAVLLQTGFLFHLSALLPDFSRLDPRRGLSRILGPQTLLETGKSLIKVVVVGWAGWHVISALVPLLPGMIGWSPLAVLSGTTGQIVSLLASMLAAQTALAGLDILRTRLQHARSLRMSRQEVRDEHKESDGNPMVKGRRRALQRQRARRRMMAAVPQATVVITNPTHYAVALAYARDGGGAPRVVAKGQDEVAARIRAAATEHRVPLVANPPLARALHQVPLDAEIPAEHYRAVAEVIAYVWGLRTRGARAA